jgi:hypothetical protein
MFPSLLALLRSAGRANTTLGSSKQWASAGSMSGALSNNCDTNPVFCNHTKVWMACELAVEAAGLAAAAAEEAAAEAEAGRQAEAEARRRRRRRRLGGGGGGGGGGSEAAAL